VTVLEFLEFEKKSEQIESMPEMAIARSATKKTVKRPIQRSMGDMPVTTKKSQNTKSLDRVLVIYDERGRIRLPVDFIKNLDEETLANRTFDFRNPDSELADTFLKRPPVMDFEPTRFESAWQPDQDVLTELLTKAVEKSTASIKIPVPGDPTIKLVCVVSVLAMGGGCGFVPVAGYPGRVIPDVEDDPATLSPEEEEQCQAWWEKISNTRSQREWMKTKKLYELTCKKPLAKPKIQPRE